MNENRQQAYLNLIQALLNCPNGAEQPILTANRQLIDAGLIDTMTQVAAGLAERGESQTADFLVALARQFWVHVTSQLSEEVVSSQSLPFFESIQNADSQPAFLMQVLEAIVTSQGNPQVLSPLLQANLDQINDHFAKVLNKWATSTLSRIDNAAKTVLAKTIGTFSASMAEFPLGNKATNLEIAIMGYKIVATVFNRDAFPQEWAMTLNGIGNAYLHRLKGERLKNLEFAIKCYQRAKHVYTREKFPEEWAKIQNSLGNAYFERLHGKKTDNLEQAIKYYRFALQEYTRDGFPEQWAMLQHNLGVACLYRLKGERLKNLTYAIGCFKRALQIRTRDSFPQEYAHTQDHLRRAYLSVRNCKAFRNL